MKKKSSIRELINNQGKKRCFLETLIEAYNECISNNFLICLGGYYEKIVGYLWGLQDYGVIDDKEWEVIYKEVNDCWKHKKQIII